MGSVTILEHTTKKPIRMIGEMAGVCWGSATDNDEANITRALNCIKSNHGRTLEFPDVYMVLDGYSARVIREWYTHIGGAPTRLQSSTRYVNAKNFAYITPPSVAQNPVAKTIYENCMEQIRSAYAKLMEAGIPKEDCALALPLGMETRIVCKHNLRNHMDMSRQRMCSRAYHEYRKLFSDVCTALSNYSPEWETLVNMLFHAKCEETKTCPEERGCGRYPKKDN